MKKNEIQVGQCYRAKVSGKLTTVRVDDICEGITVNDKYVTGIEPSRRQYYKVTNLTTGRKTTFRSAQKFQAIATPAQEWRAADNQFVKEYLVPTLAEKFKPAVKPAPHLVIEALAGTGKTTTLVEGLKAMLGRDGASIDPSPQQQAIWDSLCLTPATASVCFVAFNKSIADELKRRVPENCNAMTMHSLGLKTVTSAFGRVVIEQGRVQNILEEITGVPIRDLRYKKFEAVKAAEELVGLCKMNLVTPEVDPTSYAVKEAAVKAGFTPENPVPEGWLPKWQDCPDGWNTDLFEDNLDKLASHYEVELNGSKTQVYKWVPVVLARCMNVDKDRMIDFDDMIWLPVACDLNVAQYDLLLVDEAQDLNRCQQALAKKAGRRLVLCGDTHQAIYGFAGADSESMQRMKMELTSCPACEGRGYFPVGDGMPDYDCNDCNGTGGCKVLPLTVTRRCGRAIVAEAQRIVPAFEAHENNGEGWIGRACYKQQEQSNVEVAEGVLADLREGRQHSVEELEARVSYHEMVQDGDMVLCRVNAPLVSQCFKFLKAGRRAEIQGRNIAQGLISTVKKVCKNLDVPYVNKLPDYSKVGTPDLVEKLSDWINQETAKENRKRNPSESRLINLNDRYDCLICFTEGMVNVQQVIDRIESVFTDKENPHGIRLSTIHRAKGLEAKRVFLLEPEGATVPHPMAKSKWQREQEMNLRYVAITRAIEELVYVK